MTMVLTPNAVQRFEDNNGNPLAGGQLFTYQAGTSTPAATYQDSIGTPNTNPIVLNARGECNLWLPPNVAFKYVLQDSFGNTVWTVDQVTNSQLLTLWGGTDNGSANAYKITFVAPFNALTDGTAVIWVPANTNTGASTINVNGLGNVNLTNRDGTALTAGQITVNQMSLIVFKSPNWYRMI